MSGNRKLKSLIDKEYFTLEEVVEEFAVPWRDITYLAENGHLRLSVLVYTVFVEVGHVEQICADEWVHQPDEDHWLTGLVDLCDRDAHLILKNGSAEVGHFKAAPNKYCSLADRSRPLIFKTSDLLLRKAERQVLDKLIKSSPEIEKVQPFAHSDDYGKVTIDGRMFSLGERQAMVVRRLHEAALAGQPWQNGKALLQNARSQSTRLHDLFKSKGPDWHQLILSDGRGLYRLAIPDQSRRSNRRKTK